MAAPALITTSHPFHSRERVNFPEFSPIFSKHVTPEAAKRGFRWSIDHIARLKPADIDTDPFTLVKTNGQSPENDEETQQVSERFFSQHSILPSPWPTRQPKSSDRYMPTAPSAARVLPQPSHTPGQTKKVTFSPHPPSMAYIRNESMESELRENALVDAATQTALTIPLAYNLDEILGPVCTYEESGSGVRDLANSYLRRKLFGQPERIIEEAGEEQGEGEGGGEGEEEGEIARDDNMQSSTAYVTPSKCLSNDRHLSSTPLNPQISHNHKHSSHSSPIISSGMGGASNTNPTASSLVLSPGENVPEFSPIEGVLECGAVSAARPKENSEACKRLFSITPKKKSAHLTPSPLPTCPPFSPILSHHSSEGVGGGCEGVRGAIGECMTAPTTPISTATQNRVSSESKATSTPYHHGLKRQLATSSHSSSPLADTPCAREDEKAERRADTAAQKGERGGEGGWWGGERVEVVIGEVDRASEGKEADNGSETSDDLPQPLSMANLQTETYEDDLTSVTGVTTCTSYFTQLATDDGDSNAANERQPLHSTVAIPNSVWNPLTTAEPHQGAPFTEDNMAACYRLPSIREISRINAPSMNATDSGVAASSYFNQPTGGSPTQLTNSGGTGALNSTNRAPIAGLENDENRQTDKNSKKNGVDIAQKHGEIGCRSTLVRSEVDSGLVTSPDQDPRGGCERDTGGLLRSRPPFSKPSTPGDKLHSNLPPHSTNITPSRYSAIQLYRNRLGVPLAITQKSAFNNRTFLRSSVLPSQLKLTPALPLSLPRTSPGLSNKVKASRTPTRHTGYSNWVGGSVIGQNGFTTSPIFPDEVVRKKEMLKARLQFCSPVRSRSPVSPLPPNRNFNNALLPSRKLLVDTLNLLSPVTAHPFTNLPVSPLPPSHPQSSPLPSTHLLSPLPPHTFSPSYNHFPSSPPLPLSPLHMPRREVHARTSTNTY